MKKTTIETGEENKVLRTKSVDLKSLNIKTPKLGLGLSDFVNEMKTQLNSERGYGIAAPQVGENLKVILVRIDSGTANEILFAMINPEITWKSWNGDVKVVAGKNTDEIPMPEGAAVDEEGCLSLPRYYVNVMRAKEISVNFFDGRSLLKGKAKVAKVKDLPFLSLKLKDLNARIVQHEVDHLNGILICDKVA